MSNDPRPLPRMADYGAHFRRYWRRLTTLSVVGALVGATLFFLLEPQYVATSRVLVSPQITYLSLRPEQERQPLVTLDTTAALLFSSETIDRVSEEMGVSRAAAIDSLKVTAKPLSRILIIQVTADTEVAARQGLVAAVTSMLEQQADTFALGSERLSLLKRRVATLEAQAQNSISAGAPAQSLFDTVRLLQARLERAIATNNTTSEVVAREGVREFRPAELETYVVSGLALGIALALLSAGAVSHAPHIRRRVLALA